MQNLTVTSTSGSQTASSATASGNVIIFKVGKKNNPTGGDAFYTATFDIKIPCDVQPDALTHLYNITYAPDPGYPGETLVAPPYPLQLTKTIMHAYDFRDDSHTLLPVAAIYPDLCPPPQKLLVGRDHHRYFKLYVADGIVTDFKLIYGPELEITPHSLTFTGPAGPIVCSPVGNIYTFTPAMLASAGFPNAYMALGDEIDVDEGFDVTSCTIPNNDSTAYTLIWDCPEDPAVDHACNSETARRAILVEASDTSLTPKIYFERPAGTPGDLDFCPGQPSDVIVSFQNGTYNKSFTLPGPCPLGDDKLAGSAEVTLNYFLFPFKQDVFGLPGSSIPLSSIFLEGAGTSPSPSVDPGAGQLPAGFYTYNPSPTTPIPASGNMPAIPPTTYC